MSYVQRRRFLWILLLVALVLTAIAANATTLARMRFDELAQRATAIARMRCLGAESRWQDGEIWTETRFEVLDSKKGALPGIVSVRMIGGSAGHLHSRVEGVPKFQAGEEVYLFLWGNAEEPYRVLGWSEGTFRISLNPQTGIEEVTQDSAAEAIFDAKKREFRRGGIRNLPVAAFELKLRRALREATQ